MWEVPKGKRRVLVVGKRAEKLEIEGSGGRELVEDLLRTFGDSLVMCRGLLTGTGAPSGGKYAIGVRNGSEEVVGVVGGFIGAYMVGYGIDCLMLLPVDGKKIVEVSKEGVVLKDAQEFIGMGAVGVQRYLERGKKTVAVGPAGESGSSISAIVAEGVRVIGRGAGRMMWNLGFKVAVFYPSSPPPPSERLARIFEEIRIKLKASSDHVVDPSHVCYGCPIRCAAMKGRLKKGIYDLAAKLGIPNDEMESLVSEANDAGVDVFGLLKVGKLYDMNPWRVLDLAKEGKEPHVQFEKKQVDEYTRFLDSVGLCKEAAALLNPEDVRRMLDITL